MTFLEDYRSDRSSSHRETLPISTVTPIGKGRRLLNHEAQRTRIKNETKKRLNKIEILRQGKVNKKKKLKTE